MSERTDAGSTVVYVVERLVSLGKETNANRYFVPTGFQAKNLIVDGGLQLGDIEVLKKLDITLDGADEYVVCLTTGWMRR